jgi:hypothetical protein
LHPTLTPVELGENNDLLQYGTTNKVGNLPNCEATDAIQALRFESLIHLQMHCTILPNQQIASREGRRCSQQYTSQIVLCVIIYGPPSLKNEIGEFATERDLYLQDPIHCDRDVPYQNPHLLSRDDDRIVMTSSLNFEENGLRIEDMVAPPDPWALLKTDTPLSETEGSSLLRTKLFRLAMPFFTQALDNYTKCALAIKNKL